MVSLILSEMSKTVIICWGHSVIKDIIAEFGGEKWKDWDDKDYDRTIVLDFYIDGSVTVKELKQKLMYKDSE